MLQVWPVLQSLDSPGAANIEVKHKGTSHQPSTLEKHTQFLGNNNCLIFFPSWFAYGTIFGAYWLAEVLFSASTVSGSEHAKAWSQVDVDILPQPLQRPPGSGKHMDPAWTSRSVLAARLATKIPRGSRAGDRHSGLVRRLPRYASYFHGRVAEAHDGAPHL